METRLVEVTTARQIVNGTRMFRCKRTGVRYGSYASGYVRREVDGMLYQLNRREEYEVVSFSNPESYRGVKSVKIPSERERLLLIEVRSKSYRRSGEDMSLDKFEEDIGSSMKFDSGESGVVDLGGMSSSRSYVGSRKNLKWPSYIVQVVHSSMMLDETPSMIADRIDQMLVDIPGHRFVFRSWQEKVEAVYNVMEHLKTRARQSVSRMIEHIDNIDRSRG